MNLIHFTWFGIKQQSRRNYGAFSSLPGYLCFHFLLLLLCVAPSVSSSAENRHFLFRHLPPIISEIDSIALNIDHFHPLNPSPLCLCSPQLNNSSTFPPSPPPFWSFWPIFWSSLKGNAANPNENEVWMRNWPKPNAVCPIPPISCTQFHIAIWFSFTRFPNSNFLFLFVLSGEALGTNRCCWWHCLKINQLPDSVAAQLWQWMAFEVRFTIVSGSILEEFKTNIVHFETKSGKWRRGLHSSELIHWIGSIRNVEISTRSLCFSLSLSLSLGIFLFFLQWGLLLPFKSFLRPYLSHYLRSSTLNSEKIKSKESTTFRYFSSASGRSAAGTKKNTTACF